MLKNVIYSPVRRFVRSMSTIFITRQLPPHLLKPFVDKKIKVKMWPSSDIPVPRNELLHEIVGCHGLLCLLTDRVDSNVLTAAGTQLRAISTLSVGYDHIDLVACRAAGIRVGHTPNVLTDATADLTLGLILAVCRRFQEATSTVRDGRWGTWQTFWMCGRSLKSMTVGVVGAGRIGLAVMQRVRSFNVSRILYCTSGQAKPEAAEIGAEHSSFEDLLANSDIVVVCCALTAKTRHLFNKTAFAAMKPQSLFVNTARGDVVDQVELAAVLRSGHLAGAGLDVTSPEPLPLDSELLKFNNCLILPHIGSATVDTRENMIQLAVDNLLAALEDRPLPAEVNLQGH